jgi:hypothetical protein
MKISAVIIGLIIATIGITGMKIFDPGTTENISTRSVLDPYAYYEYLFFYAGATTITLFGLMCIYYGMNAENKE